MLDHVSLYNVFKGILGVFFEVLYYWQLVRSTACDVLDSVGSDYQSESLPGGTRDQERKLWVTPLPMPLNMSNGNLQPSSWMKYTAMICGPFCVDTEPATQR